MNVLFTHSPTDPNRHPRMRQLTESVECEHETLDVGEIEFEIRHLLVALRFALGRQRHVLDQLVEHRRHLGMERRWDEGERKESSIKQSSLEPMSWA